MLWKQQGLAGAVPKHSCLDILWRIHELGGSIRRYEDGRRETMPNLVAEIYGRPGVTRTIKLFLELGLSLDFVFDFVFFVDLILLLLLF